MYTYTIRTGDRHIQHAYRGSIIEYKVRKKLIDIVIVIFSFQWDDRGMSMCSYGIQRMNF